VKEVGPDCLAALGFVAFGVSLFGFIRLYFKK
jgi:hypothetical protein